MTWPTISKGIFYPGYAKGMNQGPAPSERDVTIPASPTPWDSGVTHVRVVQGGNQQNEVNMRKPFG